MYPIRPKKAGQRRVFVPGLLAGLACLGLIAAPSAALSPDSSAPVTALAAADPVRSAEQEAILVATEVGAMPDLPDEVTFTTDSGTPEEHPVTWHLDGYTFSAPFTTYEVQGTTDEGLVANAAVYSVLKDTTYFVDSGSDAAPGLSPIWDAVKADAGETLLQDVSDQQYAGGATWGYVRTTEKSPQLCGAPADSVEYDLYARIWCAERDGFSYKLTFPEPGSYTIVAGTVEMWPNQNREMTFEYRDSDGTRQTIGETFNLGDQGERHVQTGVIEASSGSGELYLAQGAGGATPQIAWFTVARGSQDVPEAVAPGAPLIAPGTLTFATDSVTTEIRDLDRSGLQPTIIYTTDGSQPGPINGEVYDGEFTVDRPADRDEVTVKAVAWRDGLTSRTAEAVYTFVDHEAGPDAYDSVPVGEPWYDTDGDLIQAHGGGFLKEGDWYYWVGENKEHNHANFWAVSLYRSKDLLNWEFVNDILTEESDGAGDRLSTMNMKVERPKLVYNEKTEQYVLWGHWEERDSYGPSRLVVATSETIDGLYTYVDDFRPGEGEVWDLEQEDAIQQTVNNGTYASWDEAVAAYAATGHEPKGHQSRDFTVYVDPDDHSRAYLISAEAHEQLRIYPLTDDFTQADWSASYPLFQGDSREAAAVVKVDDIYYLFTSGQSGWYPNQLMYAYTDDLSSPDGWSELINTGNNTSFKSQPTWIMDIQATDGSHGYVYMGDRWDPSALGQSTYVWLPLDFSAGEDEVRFEYNPDWKLDVASGEVIVPEQQLLSERKPSYGSRTGTAVRYVASQADYSALPDYGSDGYEREWYVVDAEVVDRPALAANDGRSDNLAPWDNSQYYKPYPGDAGEKPWSWSVDLLQPAALDRIDISWRSHNGSETYSAYSIYGSQDGEDWTLLADREDNSTVGFTSDALSGTYQWVKVVVSKVVNDHNGNEADWAAGLVEVQVYGDQAADTSTLMHAIEAATLGDTSGSSRESVAAAQEILDAAIAEAQKVVDDAAADPGSITVSDLHEAEETLSDEVAGARAALVPAVESVIVALAEDAYVAGDDFDPATVTVTATRSDGSEQVLEASDYELSAPDLSAAGSAEGVVSVRTGLLAVGVDPIEETFTVQVAAEADTDGSGDDRGPGDSSGGSDASDDSDGADGTDDSAGAGGSDGSDSADDSGASSDSDAAGSSGASNAADGSEGAEGDTGAAPGEDLGAQAGGTGTESAVDAETGAPGSMPDTGSANPAPWLAGTALLLLLGAGLVVLRRRA